MNIAKLLRPAFFYRAPLAAASEIEEIRDNSLHQLQPQMTHTNNQENLISQNILNSLVHMYVQKLRIAFLQNLYRKTIRAKCICGIK